MDPKVTNPVRQSYTKKELRLLLTKPDIDLSCPVGVEPVTHYILSSKVEKILARLGDTAKFNLQDWNTWRKVPAHVCELILTINV